MRNNLIKYGMPHFTRPKIIATKKLDLTGEEGKEIVRQLTIKTLKNHKNTFAKLAGM